MKKLILLSTFFFSISIHALPDCPSDTASSTWNNCYGTFTFTSGAKYVGEYKDGKWHGQGTYVWSDGARETGFYMNGQYISDICENMGLVKGTESFGNCVFKLIDDL